MLPPSLNPFISPAASPEPSESFPLPYAIQFLIVTTPIEPVAGLAYRSHPSSELQYEIHPSNTLPSPHVSLAANPSAFSPFPPSSTGSTLLNDVQLIIRLLLGHASLVGCAFASFLAI